MLRVARTSRIYSFDQVADKERRVINVPIDVPSGVPSDVPSTRSYLQGMWQWRDQWGAKQWAK